MAERIHKRVHRILKQEIENKELVDDFIADEIAGVYPEAETIEFTELGFRGWGNSGGYRVDGGENMVWIRDVKEAETIAVQIVDHDLKERPEMYNPDWLEDFVSIRETDRAALAEDEAEMFMKTMSDEDIITFLGVEEPETQATMDALRSDMTRWYRDVAYKDMEKPITYFVKTMQSMSLAALMDQPWIQIDKEAAAQAMVALEGWSKILNTADTLFEKTPGGVVYFRD